MRQEDSSNSGPRPAKRRHSSALEGTTIRTLLAADLVDSTNFIREVGDEKAAELFAAIAGLIAAFIGRKRLNAPTPSALPSAT